MGSKVLQALYGALVLLFLAPCLALRLRVMKTECLEIPVKDAGSQLLVRLVVFGKHAGTKLAPGITLSDPHGNTLQEHQGQSELSFQQSADWPGLYRVCLAGQGTTDVDLSLEVLPPTATASKHVEEDHLDEVSGQVVALINQLKALQGDQAYLRSREARQEEVMQSLSSRVINLFLAECVILFSVGLFQLYMVIKFASKKAK